MRRTQPITKGQIFFNNPCPIGTMVTWYTKTRTRSAPRFSFSFCRKKLEELHLTLYPNKSEHTYLSELIFLGVKCPYELICPSLRQSVSHGCNLIFNLDWTITKQYIIVHQILFYILLFMP